MAATESRAAGRTGGPGPGSLAAAGLSAARLIRRLQPAWRLLRVCALPSEVLGAHAHAYGELATLELAREWALWRRRAMLQVLGLSAGLCAAVLAGVGLMLWAVLPLASAQAPWALWVAPLLPAVVAVACLWAAHATVGPPAFGGIRRQWAADMAMLRGQGPGDMP